MGKLIMWNIITLDGYFDSEKNWELPFHQLIWGPEAEAFSLKQLHGASYLVFGRVTYEGMADYWRTATGEIAELMNSLPKVVCSRTLQQADWNNSQLISGNIAAEVRQLKSGSSGDLYVFGSANLSETLLQEGLFDELRICIAPVLAGRGRHLFREGFPETSLTCTDTQVLSNGGIILTYQTKS